MKCSKCSYELKEGAKFCPKCGNKVEITESQSVKGTCCPKCGAKISSDTKFCGVCGEQIKQTIFTTETTYVPVYTPPAKKEKKTKRGTAGIVALILVICIAVASCVVAAFVLLENQTDDKPRIEVNDKKEEKQEVEKPKKTSYKVVKSNSSWLDASQKAEEMGGYLVSVNTEEEFDRICNMAGELGVSVFWIGAKRDSGDSWVDSRWMDGKKITYTKWFDGEPTYRSEEGLEEKYLMVFKVNGVWYYNDAQNDVSEFYADRMGYIVEVEE